MDVHNVKAEASSVAGRLVIWRGGLYMMSRMFESCESNCQLLYRLRVSKLELKTQPLKWIGSDP